MTLLDQNITEMEYDEIKVQMGHISTGNPLFMGAMSELTRRDLIELRNSLGTLNTSVNTLKDSSDGYSKKLVGLTWILVVFTIALVALTIFLIIDGEKQGQIQDNIALNTSFFNSTNTGIISNIENNQPILVEDHGKYTDAQLDNYLGSFDTVEGAFNDGSLNESDLCDSFSYFVEITSQNSEVQKYIALQQKTDPGFFVSLNDLSNVISKSKNSNCK